MRKDPHNPDKTLGYILVPLYLEMTTGESIEDAVAKADFREVWNVLQALQEQDEVLVDIIRQMQEDKGRGEGQKGDDFGDIIDILGVDISLKILQESITAVCIDKLGFAWDLRYGELIKYKKKFGDCNVPSGWTENQQLAYWVTSQRAKYRKGQLTEDHIKRLENIGFVWNILESKWEQMFDALKEYKKDHGDFKVYKNWKEDYINLTQWVSIQCANYQKGILSEGRIKRLEDIGFVFNLVEPLWEEMFEALQEYRENHLHCNVPDNWEENKQLAKWVDMQRVYYKNKIISNEYVKRLENICFEWERGLPLEEEEEWEKLFDSLKEYKKDYGDCNVSVLWKLGQWAMAQRTNYINMNLSEDRIKRLASIGFEWTLPSEEVKEKSLEERLSKSRFKRLEDIDIERTPSRKDMDEKTRRKKQRRLLSKESAERWEYMFDALIKYKKEHGDYNVPFDRNRQLATWVSAQRSNYKRGKLTIDRIKHLEEIGFVWKLNESNWEKMFETLKEFKDEHGDCDVPHTWADRQLGRWVNKQRGEYKRKDLSDVHIKRLEDIDFVWDTHESSWEQMFDALKEYRNIHGDCNVPHTWTENKQLYQWVMKHRNYYKKGKLAKDRIKRLEDIGFVWKINK